ncbi:MAG: CotH kinase family protein [Candidatus Cryptobacteroides sp.]
MQNLKFNIILAFFAAVALLLSCEPDIVKGSIPDNTEQGNGNENENEGENSGDNGNGGEEGGPTEDNGGDNGGENTGENVPPAITDEGIAYVWDDTVIPEITMKVSLEQWNAFLARYDEYDQNADYFHADFTFKKGNEVTAIQDGGFRIRGNTSRRRPEGSGGQQHVSGPTDWHHCHFGLNFRKFNKDKAHTIKGIRKINLKWFKDDPTYVRELYCYDLFRRYGIWTAPFDGYCRLWIQVEGDAKPAYFGVYQMIEAIDDKYVEKRLAGMFGSAEGNLWKCANNGNKADLHDLDGDWALDTNDGVNHTYEYKGEEANYEVAKTQFQDFIQKLTGKGEESFYNWIKQVCDVEFLLKTYAVNVAVGMWDDHWVNGNNFYVYFNSMDQYDYKFFLIPYDYDNTLGTSGLIDAGRQNPYEWGEVGHLMKRLMKFDEFRQIYKNALLELIDPSRGLFHIDASLSRIKAWQDRIRDYVSNDTGEDMSIYDQPASWGNHGEYRVMETGPNNFFTVKAGVIKSMN